jgi:hypothetical protein
MTAISQGNVCRCQSNMSLGPLIIQCNALFVIVVVVEIAIVIVVGEKKRSWKRISKNVITNRNKVNEKKREKNDNTRVSTGRMG